MTKFTLVLVIENSNLIATSPPRDMSPHIKFGANPHSGAVRPRRREKVIR